jgi:hypothetical protein
MRLHSRFIVNPQASTEEAAIGLNVRPESERMQLYPHEKTSHSGHQNSNSVKSRVKSFFFGRRNRSEIKPVVQREEDRTSENAWEENGMGDLRNEYELMIEECQQKMLMITVRFLDKKSNVIKLMIEQNSKTPSDKKTTQYINMLQALLIVNERNYNRQIMKEQALIIQTRNDLSQRIKIFQKDGNSLVELTEDYYVIIMTNRRDRKRR